MDAKDSHMIDVVCALIENQSGQLLACKRAASTHLGGYWEFPGGKIEQRETAPDALKPVCPSGMGCFLPDGTGSGSDGVIGPTLRGPTNIVVGLLST